MIRTYLFISLLLFSCTDKKQLELLIQENRELRQEMAELKTKQYPCKFYTLISTEKDHFKQHEKGSYDISLAIFDDVNKPIIILRNPETNRYEDTLIMENGYVERIPFNTAKPGEHIIEGKIQCLLNNRKEEELFQIKYVVE